MFALGVSQVCDRCGSFRMSKDKEGLFKFINSKNDHRRSLVFSEF